MEKQIKKNEKYIVDIIDYGMDGEGVAKIDNFTVFIPNGLHITIFKSPEFYISAVIFALCTFLVFNKRKKIQPVLIICIAAVLGIIAGYTFNL